MFVPGAHVLLGKPQFTGPGEHQTPRCQALHDVPSFAHECMQTQRPSCPLEKIRADLDLVYSVAAVSGFAVCSSQWDRGCGRESDALWSRTAWCKRPRGWHTGQLQLRVRCAYHAVSGKRGTPTWREPDRRVKTAAAAGPPWHKVVHPVSLSCIALAGQRARLMLATLPPCPRAQADSTVCGRGQAWIGGR